MSHEPRLLFTMGDVAGIGPEILVRAWPELIRFCRPVIVGDPEWLRRALHLTGASAQVRVLQQLDGENDEAGSINCIPGTDENVSKIVPGRVQAAAGKAAYDFLCTAIDQVMAGQADGIVTSPLHKEGLHAAGLPYPGHTEILAERTGTREFGMVLYTRSPEIPHGLAVVHVTLHMALRQVFNHLSQDAIYEKIRLLDDLLRRLLDRRPRLAVAALNPHASDGGLFGDEEARVIEPAVARARQAGYDVSGPWPADALFVRARQGEFHGVVAMYHDQGHIALKLLGAGQAVNISVGLPLVRTSVAHGTAYDIAGKGVANPASLIEAARVARQLVRGEGRGPRGEG